MAASKKSRRAFAATSGVAATALAGNVLFASVASAHVPSAWHGSDYAYIQNAAIFSGENHGDKPHNKIVVEDGECDGHAVWADFQISGETFTRRIADDNGCEAPGRGWIDDPRGREIFRFRVCEQDANPGCSAWQDSGEGGGK